jgi:hypothetical protein
LTTRVAAYRLLAFLVAECNDGRKVECARGNIRGFAAFVVLSKGIRYASSSQPVVCWRVVNVADRLAVE